jgi:allantoin racemase
VHIKIINANTTWAMTETIGACARDVAAVGTVISAVSPPMGPASIESHYDEALSVPGVLHEIAEGERDGVDGYVIACFGDPGLDAARELAAGPVVGIAEAAMHTATLLGRSFSVVTSLSRTIGRTEDLVRHYGFDTKCTSVYACDIPVLGLEDPASDAVRAIVELCWDAVTHDGADSIVLGCAGMADLCDQIAAEVGVPVIDGVGAATKLVEGLVSLGYSTSVRDEFAHPLPKAYTGLLSGFELRPPDSITPVVPFASDEWRS